MAGIPEHMLTGTLVIAGAYPHPKETNGMIKPSVRSTYSSTHEPNPYHVSVRLGDETIVFQRPIADPFVRQDVTISPRRLLRSLLHWKPLTVTVLVGGDKERIDDVLELDDQWLVPGRTRHAAFHQHINERLGQL